MIFNFRRIPPNKIDTIESPEFVGRIGMVACPGIRIGGGQNQQVAKNLKSDLQALKDWGVTGVVSLVEEHELSIVGVEGLPQKLESEGVWWRHMPIMDMYVPEEDFEEQWAEEGKRIRSFLKRGEHIIFHCYAGLGRTGLVVAKILVDFGMEPEEAINAVRKANKRRIQTKEQAEYIRALR